jgi:hypothetical protein
MTREERLTAERKLKRKIDVRLLPVLVVMYILSILLLGPSDVRLPRPECDRKYATRWHNDRSWSCWKSIPNVRFDSFRWVIPSHSNLT